MNFLVDHQRPPALARFLETQGHTASHVRELGLKEADDEVVWTRAATDAMTVVSKDEDFYYIASAPGAKGRLVWVRVGNCRTEALLQLFGVKLPQILEAFESGARIVEIR